ncbi:hypothetical protein [Agarilytica rhodophyticola]|uniref:hypothetical protein n=1 Tax=Agarilytica rhodophyticola TaxID=1737490 RepID=UPI000B346DCD|nr:hypothetical protein [Agarilytica rhodophyticola]
MRTKKQAQDAVLLDPTKRQALDNDMDRFIAKARRLPKDEAITLVKAQAPVLFDSYFPFLNALEEAKIQAEKNKKIADARRDAIANALLETPKRLDAPPENAKGLIGGLSQISLSDFIQLGLYGGLATLSMFTAYSNVLANLLGTGLPIFIDDPSKAKFIALLSVGAAAAIKNLPSMFKRETEKSLCKRVITGITGLSAFAWMALFSAEYNGLSSDLPDLDFSLESNNSGNWLSFTQIFTEVMVSACLFMRVTSILDTYQPPQKRDNTEHGMLEADLVEAEVMCTPNNNTSAQAKNANTQLKAEKEAFTNDALARLAVAQAQYNDLHK